MFGILKKSSTVNPSCKDVCQLCFWSIICWKNLPLSTNMFYNFEEKKRTLSKMIWGRKKNSILLPQNACVKIFVHKDFFCFLKGILYVFITASWRRIDRADFEQIIDQTKFLAFLERKHNNSKTFSLWRALFCYVSSKLFSPYW